MEFLDLKFLLSYIHHATGCSREYLINNTNRHGVHTTTKPDGGEPGKFSPYHP